MLVSDIDTASRSGESPHRPGGISFINLAKGEEFARDNFLFTIVDIEQDFFTPRHRHNFEQVRIMLEGGMKFGPGHAQEAGSVGYFCEGTYYTQQGVGHSRTLLLQVAGPSGEGYMSRTQMDGGIAALQREGSFAKGLYAWTDESGQTHTKDGYEAAWEKVFGRRITYAEPRFDAPVIFWPDRFSYVPDGDGVARRTLGVFHERGLSIAQLRLEPGATVPIDGGAKPWLLFTLNGEGTADGVAWRRHTAIHVCRGEVVSLTASAVSELYLIGLPTFDDLGA